MIKCFLEPHSVYLLSMVGSCKVIVLSMAWNTKMENQSDHAIRYLLYLKGKAWLCCKDERNQHAEWKGSQRVPGPAYLKLTYSIAFILPLHMVWRRFQLLLLPTQIPYLQQRQSASESHQRQNSPNWLSHCDTLFIEPISSQFYHFGISDAISSSKYGTFSNWKQVKLVHHYALSLPTRWQNHQWTIWGHLSLAILFLGKGKFSFWLVITPALKIKICCLADVETCEISSHILTSSLKHIYLDGFLYILQLLQ